MQNVDAKSVPSVSIVIPTYGRKQFLMEAVASVIKQTFTNWELYIVDDASPIPVEEKQFADRRIRVLRHECNKGPGAARNSGAAVARGEWLAFLDDDDLWDENRLECALKWATHKQAEICVTWTRPMEVAASQYIRGRSLEGDCHAEIMTATSPHFGATMILRQAFVPLNESYQACEDLDWWIRITKRASVTTVPVPLHLWRRHDSPRHRTDISERIAQSWRLLRDHRDYFQAYPAASAFRLFRLGYMLQRSGQYGEAVTAYWRVVTGNQVAPHLRAAAARRLIEVTPRAWFSS